MRECRGCRLLLPDDQYYWDRRGRLKSPDCKVCYSAGEARRHALKRQQVFDHYGWQCRCCSTAQDLTIDHVNGDGYRHRADIFGTPRSAGARMYGWLVANGFPDGFQTLCRPCNFSKRVTEHCRLTH